MNKIISVIAVWIFTAAVLSPAAEPKLHIKLNENVVIHGSRVSLGHISALTGPEELVKKARDVMMGTFSTQGQVLYADRNTILSRLAAVGIPVQEVELTGPEKAQIRRDEKYVEPQRLMETARTFLDKQLEGHDISSVEVIGTPSLVVLNDPNASARLVAKMSRYQTPGTKKVMVAVIQNDVQIAQREITFEVRFWSRRIVARHDLLPGSVIRIEDVIIERVESPSPQPADWKEPFGLAVKRRIANGSQIHPDWLSPPQAPILIKRNQQVVVQLDTGSMYLSASGQAMDEGRPGELIRVKRGQKPDERIIYCMIQADGTVQPKI